MIGKIFDNTSRYLQNQNEVKKLVNYYFAENEIKNKVVLDAGCRVGDYVQPFLERGARMVVGVDLSGECLKIARKRYHQTQVKFYQSDIADLSRFPDSTFDAVWCSGTMMYLSPAAAQTALTEFIRITHPGGTIVIMFQKEKGWLVRLMTFLANQLPINLYLFLIENWAFLIKPLAEKIIGRRVNLNYLKYDVLLSLRGIYFGLPVAIDKKYRLKTITSKLCSETTTISFKIKVIK